MNFDDRLRNHLHEQGDELAITREGADAIRSRSKRRKQKRAGAGLVGVMAIGLLAAGFIWTQSDDDVANVATDGDTSAVEDGSTTTVVGVPSDDPIEATSALPEPGSPLTLSGADNTNAPGGYNVAHGGRAGGLYYVVSTAPGVTYDDLDQNDGYFRNDTIYTFDGSSWTNTSAGDRFVSSFDDSTPGVLYAVSTGSATTQELEVGSSRNGGANWEWTQIDLTTTFGEDRSQWPAYNVQYATNAGQRLVVVRTFGEVDIAEAFALASAAGVEIDSPEQIFGATSDGLSWIDTEPVSPCQAAETNAINELWEAETDTTDFEYSEDITDAEAAEREQYFEQQNVRANEIRTEALAAVAAVPGCETYVKCSNGYVAQLQQFEQEIQERVATLGLPTTDDPTDEELAAMDKVYEIAIAKVNAWTASSGCEDVLPLNFNGDDGDGYQEEFALWEDLGVTVPESWQPSTAAFLVDGDAVSNLGNPFGNQSGFMAGVEHANGEWKVRFDTTDYTPSTTNRPTPTMTTFSSSDGNTWATSTTDPHLAIRQHELSNGVSFAISWEQDESTLLRYNADGSVNSLALADLAPDIDTDRYMLFNVSTGNYGAVVSAVRWENSEDDEFGSYDSIVLYSPDGIGWGATEVPDVEVVRTVVGDDDVLIFLNDPNRDEGTPQPILLGS